jgi:hypothetical protein
MTTYQIIQRLETYFQCPMTLLSETKNNLEFVGNESNEWFELKVNKDDYSLLMRTADAEWADPEIEIF